MPRSDVASVVTVRMCGKRFTATAPTMVTITQRWPTPALRGNAQRPKAFSLKDPRLCAAIETSMDDGWSPRLIAQMLAKDHPDDKLMQVSHEIIYKALYVQTRGHLRADLHKQLSTKRTARKTRGHATGPRGVYASGEEFTDQ